MAGRSGQHRVFKVQFTNGETETMLSGRLAVLVSAAFLVTELPSVSAQKKVQFSQNPMLGVNVQESDLGLVVRSINADSPASGRLREGDVLRFLTAEGHPVYSIQTLNHLEKAKQAIGLDVSAFLEVQRGTERVFFSLIFQSAGAFMGQAALNAVENPAMAVFDGHSTRTAHVATIGYDPFDTVGPSQWSPLQACPLEMPRLVIAKAVKADDGTDRIAVLKPWWIEESETITYTVTKMSTETRTRSAKDPQTGEIVEQTYQVCVPYAEEVQGTRTVLKPAEGSNRVDIPLDGITAWRIGGQRLTATELPTELATATRIFVLPPGQTSYQYDPYFVSAIGQHVLVMTLPDSLGDLPAIVPSSQPRQTPPAPFNTVDTLDANNPEPVPVNPIPADSDRSAVIEE